MTKIKNPLPPVGYDKKREGVSYPEFKKYNYYSKTSQKQTNVNVLLPQNLQEDKLYPVCYLLHGYLSNEDQLADKEMALNIILKNLQLDGLAREMIVVLPYIFCSREKEKAVQFDDETSLCYDNFINDLTSSLMPFVSENFPVLESRESRAISGFSMGGREALFIGVTLPETFGFVGGVCSAPGLAPGQIEANKLKFPAEFKPKLLLLTHSEADSFVAPYPASYLKIFSDNGDTPTAHILKNEGHDHTSVKPHLYYLFKNIF